jgi:hypothetical protein
MKLRKVVVLPWNDSDTEPLDVQVPPFLTRRGAIRYARRHWRHAVVFWGPTDKEEVCF